MQESLQQTSPAPTEDKWLNRNVAGVALTSFLADLGYETANAVLPSFVQGFARPALVLGAIEGAADTISSLIKLYAGWWSDRIGRRKPFVVAGYLMTGIMGAFFALASSWITLVVAKCFGWLGKGIRGPLRNAILTESIAPQHRGKAFGLHRACDTIGAVIGPLMGLWLLSYFGAGVAQFADHTSVANASDSKAVQDSIRTIFWLTIIPGIGSAVAFAIFVKEQKRHGSSPRRLWASIRAMPASFHRFLFGVGFFGMGDFAHTLLVFAAVTALTPANASAEERLSAFKAGAFLYAVRNIIHAIASYPIGALSDRIGRRGLLIAGYVLASGVMLAFAVAFVCHAASLWIFIVLFCLAGLYVSVEEALENVITADLVPQKELHGTAFGLLGLVNGFGDLLSSLIVGGLWELAPHLGMNQALGFEFSAFVMAIGAYLLFRIR